jgi:hypothetical protein
VWGSKFEADMMDSQSQNRSTDFPLRAIDRNWGRKISWDSKFCHFFKTENGLRETFLPKAH